MHDIEPYYNWRHLYIASEDDKSPFHGREYSEFVFSQTIYNHYIHPQWDNFGSLTLYLKVLFCNYNDGYCIIELLGEWNDLLYNDIMYLYREVIEPLIEEGINKFILLGENVLNVHLSEDDYYQEWFDNIDNDGWIICMNFRDHVKEEFTNYNLDYYLCFGNSFDRINWRTYPPHKLYNTVKNLIIKRLTP
ncbi:MAG: hypothetical protein ACEPOV_01680 [Hyphomicrobiales bacterium]